MNSGFIGLIKLTDRSEIMGKIKFRSEDFSDGVIITNPLILHEQIIETSDSGEMVRVEMKPWCKFSSESSFFIDRNNIITIGEADDRITEIYKKSITKYMKISSANKISLDSDCGFVSKIDEARKMLNKLYYKKALDHPETQSHTDISDESDRSEI
jgi:hypothetical protein